MPVPRDTRGRRLRLWLPLSPAYLLGLQVFFEVGFHRPGLLGVAGHTIQKLPDAGMFTLADLILSSYRQKRSLVEHRDAVGDAEGAGQLMSHHDHRHLERLL